MVGSGTGRVSAAFQGAGRLPTDSLFGIDNLPYGVFSVAGGARRVCTRLGDRVLDLSVLLGDIEFAGVFAQPSLNPLMALGFQAWAMVRDRLTERLADAISGDVLPAAAAHPLDRVTLHLPWQVADYVDFYASERHARNLGRLLRPDSDPLPRNWKHLPAGYHGRAGTVVVSGTPIIRPAGQLGLTGSGPRVFGPTHRLDVEAEIGFVVGTPSAQGFPVPIDAFDGHVFGAVVVNDWSARDIQAVEYVPLGPFLGKSFATSVSPWVVPLAALRSARVNPPPQIPAPLPYLSAADPWALDIELEVTWNGQLVSRPPYRQMYWTPAQLFAHLTSNGASLRTGDLFASGTVSGPGDDQLGSFMELSRGGAEPLRVAGSLRTFLQDGDEVTISATAPGSSGGRIGFGEVAGRVLPAAGAAGCGAAGWGAAR